jgi:hypothetical protein
MQRFPGYSFNTLPESDIQRPVRAANIVYQGVTVAAMILLLGSLWVF